MSHHQEEVADHKGELAPAAALTQQMAGIDALPVDLAAGVLADELGDIVRHVKAAAEGQRDGGIEQSRVVQPGSSRSVGPAALIDAETLLLRIQQEITQRATAAQVAAKTKATVHADLRNIAVNDDPARAQPAAAAPMLEPTVALRHVASPPRLRFNTDTLTQAEPAGARPASFRLEELLSGNDEVFVRRAYDALLQRSPDVIGLQHYLGRLGGGLPRVDVLGALSRSAEAQKLGVHVHGLKLPYALQRVTRWPVVGQIVRPVFRAFLMSKSRPSFHIKSLVAHRDEAFVREAYAAVLSRQPDAQGMDHYLTRLRNGVPKHVILGDMRYSTEGERIGTHIAGLALRYRSERLGQLPLIGWVIRFGIALGNVSKAQREWRAFENQSIGSIANAQSQIRQLTEQRHATLRHIERAYDDLLAFAETRAMRGEAQQLTTGLRNEIYRDKEVTREEFTAALRGFEQTVERIDASKAERTAFELLSGQLQSGLERARADLNTARARTDSAFEKRSSEIFFALKELSRRMAENSALQTLRSELKELANGAAEKSAVQTLRSELKEFANRSAEKGVVEAIRSELMSALQHERASNEGALREMVALLTRELESKSERSELTALTDHLVSLMQGRATGAELETVQATFVYQLEANRSEAQAELRAAAERLSRAVVELAELKADRSALDVVQQEANTAAEEVARRLQGELQSVAAPMVAQARDMKHNLLDQQRRLSLLLHETRKRLPEPLSNEQMGVLVSEDEHMLDSLYANLEDKFRGSRQDIKNRQSIYVPYIRDARAGVATAPVLDLGCGRGEWIELLGEQGLIGRGVDRNRVFLEGCRELNLDVVESEAISYLRGLQANSVGAVTAFHLIEHISHRTLIALFDEALRVLKPGGIVIFETPNPNNVQVGSCTFYLDPTHKNPLPPALIGHLLEARGFNNVETKDLHPYDPECQVTDGAPGVNDTLNRHFFSARDYFVFGRKS
ncbi:DUF4214 domain-containing protein [Paraburkholderia sediminicola]|uniref:DUF4214 domain-containing protein n=1 Tax=Paraburkholderia sediminicola TaxID=458836 RepID=UPI0038BC68EA